MNDSGVKQRCDSGEHNLNDSGVKQNCDFQVNIPDFNSVSEPSASQPFDPDISQTLNPDVPQVCNLGVPQVCNLGVPQVCDLGVPQVCDLGVPQVCNLGVPQVCNLGVPQVCDLGVPQVCDLGVPQVCELGVTQVCELQVCDPQVCFPEICLCVLPDSLLLEIFSLLDAVDIAHVAQVCRRWQTVACDESLWRQLVYRRWKVKKTPAPHRFLWRSEYQRLTDNVPNVLSEMLADHTDEVLHVSFSHDGQLFSTTSKDCTIKVWQVGFPTTLKYSQDFRSQFHWDFTQFSCFNATDTMLLVSSVKTAELDRRGYVAILSITHDFQLLQVLSMDPSQLFGTWMNPKTFLGGSLEISLERFVTTVQIKAFEVENTPPSSDTDVSMATQSGETLFTFCSENASLIKFLTVVNNPCVSQSCIQHKVYSGQGHKDDLSQGHKGDLSQGYKDDLSQGHKGDSSEGHKDHPGQGHKCHSGQGYKCHSGQGHKCHSGQGHKCHSGQGHKCHSDQGHKCHSGQGHRASTSDSANVSSLGTSGSQMTHSDAVIVNDLAASSSHAEPRTFSDISDNLSSASNLYKSPCTTSVDTSDRNASNNNNSYEEHKHTCSNVAISHSPCGSSSQEKYEATSSDLPTEHQAMSNDKTNLNDNSCLENSVCFSNSSTHSEPTCLGNKQTKTSVEVHQEEGTAYSKLCFCCRKIKNNSTMQSMECDNTDLEDYGDERFPLTKECNDNQLGSGKSRNKLCVDFDTAHGGQEKLVLEISCEAGQPKHSSLVHKADLVDQEMTDSNQECFPLKYNDVLDTCRDYQPDCANNRIGDLEDCDMTDSQQDRFPITSVFDVSEASHKDLQMDHCEDKTKHCGDYNMSNSLITSENYDLEPDNCKDLTRHPSCDPQGQCSPDYDQQGHWSSCCGQQKLRSPECDQQEDWTSCYDQQEDGSPGCDQQENGSAECDEQGHCLIYVTGEFAVALHQLGFKALSHERSNSRTDQECSSSQLDLDNIESHMVVNYSNQLIEMQQVRRPDPFDHLIDLNGHITGLCLSWDHRYLFVNCRPWIGPVDRSDPWATPELSTEIEVRVIDLLTMEMDPIKYVGHKGLSPSTMCCFIFLDTSDDFVGSGSEDCKAYVWERRYGCVVGELPHGPGVVNAVAFCPSNQEYLVTVSDDNNIRIWRSRHDMRLLFHV